jgi:hypothetical protein
VKNETHATEAKPRIKKQLKPQATGKWQERLLPMMTGVLIGLTAFFFIASFIQMSYLHWNIMQYPAINLESVTQNNLAASASTYDEQLEARQLEILARMEAYVIERRYHHANVMIMSGVWIRYLGFVTGMILALVGASFVLGKMREQVSEVEGKTSGFGFALRSTSPGIILVVLGVMLMFATIVDKDQYEVQDASVYLNPRGVELLSLPTPQPIPNLEIPPDLLSPTTSPNGSP